MCKMEVEIGDVMEDVVDIPYSSCTVAILKSRKSILAEDWAWLWKKQKQFREILVASTDLSLINTLEEPSMVNNFNDILVLTVHAEDVGGLQASKKIV